MGYNLNGKSSDMTQMTNLLQLSAPWSGIKADLVARWGRYRLYRLTLSELSNLTARDLADIGLNRSQVRAKAYEIAYGPAA
jgi:uncharacterized protein YjiS (DUF1127 family)